jgi:hypothetical protein
MSTEQLTKRPLCVICKEVELTDEEVAMYKSGLGACWYCVAETFIKIENPEMVPSAEQYGRPGETKESAMARLLAKEKFKMPIDVEAVQQGTTPAPGHQAPALTGHPFTELKFNDVDRKNFSLSFGADPTPKIKPTEIIVHGATEDTFMKFSIPLQVDTKEQQEIRRIMAGMLDVFGKLLKFGPQFASTLIELQSINPEMFLGGKK